MAIGLVQLSPEPPLELELELELLVPLLVVLEPVLGLIDMVTLGDGVGDGDGVAEASVNV